MIEIKVYADSKFHSDAPFTNVDVVFSSKDQLKSLIEALSKLLESDDSNVILEIEDDESSSNPGLSASIYFHAPGFHRDDLDLSCLATAEDLIMRFQRANRLTIGYSGPGLRPGH